MTLEAPANPDTGPGRPTVPALRDAPRGGASRLGRRSRHRPRAPPGSGRPVAWTSPPTRSPGPPCRWWRVRWSNVLACPGSAARWCAAFLLVGPALPVHTTPRRVRTLARWEAVPERERAGQRVRRRFPAAWRHEVTVDRLGAIFDALPEQWNDATDAFYLWQRMQRWAGVTTTSTCLDRFAMIPCSTRGSGCRPSGTTTGPCRHALPQPHPRGLPRTWQTFRWTTVRLRTSMRTRESRTVPDSRHSPRGRPDGRPSSVCSRVLAPRRGAPPWSTWWSVSGRRGPSLLVPVAEVPVLRAGFVDDVVAGAGTVPTPATVGLLTTLIAGGRDLP